jgi:transcriptional regulator with XRE-family HTH domain/Zn-dependent peptidase ImmA (M78 family)
MEWADVGERVREFRLIAGLSQEDLAAEVGLDRTMVAKIESGTRRIDALELARLSTALEVPLDQFLRGYPEVLSRRTLVEDTTTDAGRQSHRLEAKLLAWTRDIQQLLDFGVLLTRPVLRYPGIVDSVEAARDAAMWLRRHLDFGLEPIDSMMAVCEAAGQFVLVTDLPGEGASLVDGDVAAAVVSRVPDPGRRRATAAHELGHLVLGDEYSTDIGLAASRDDREKAIDAFAAELLLPTEAITSGWAEGGGSRDCLVILAARHRTSWSLAVRQAAHAGVVDNQTAREWRSRNPTRAELMEAIGWAPQSDFESVRVPPSYAHAVMEAWRADLVTSVRAVELMHDQLTLDDLPARQDTEPS